jgi:hypothetical protein
VANGHHWCPRYPHFPGEFHGQTLHSHDYRNPDAMHGRRVLVVGIGNSGCDIACESSRVSEKTLLSTRRRAHVIPKYLFGRPLDRICPPLVWRYVPKWLISRLFMYSLRLARGRQARFGLPEPAHHILQEHPTISSDLFNLIGHGRIKVKPDVARLDGDSVWFADGSCERINIVVYATGYHIRFPFLDAEIIDPRDNEVGLYKMVAHPDIPGLHFIGLVQAWGSLMPLAELQSKWVALQLAGRLALPDRRTMLADIARTRREMQGTYTDSPRHTIQVDYFSYVDVLKREMRRARPLADRPAPRAQFPAERRAA